MRHIPKAIAAGAVVGALGLGGLAYASTTGSSTTPAAKSSRVASVLRRAIYAQVIVEGKDHTTHTFVYERGAFTGISGGDLHLTRPDGVAASAPISATTKFRGVPEASLTTGDRVRIVERDGILKSVVGHVPKAGPAPVTPVS